jgi:hypothetical protein
VAVLAEAVLHHPDERTLLAAERDHLASDRAVGIAGVDEADEVGRDVDAELVVGGQALALLLGQLEDLGDLVEVVDPVRQLPAPVVPLLVRDVLPLRRSPAHGRAAIRAEAPRGVAVVDERGRLGGCQRAARGLGPCLRVHRVAPPRKVASGAGSVGRSDA